MRAAETLMALEAGLITEAEAVEQALIEDIDELEMRAGEEQVDRCWGCDRATWPAQIAG